MAGGRIRSNDVLVIAVIVDYALHASPRVLDVVEVPPQVAPLSNGRIVWLQNTKNTKYYVPAHIVVRNTEFGTSSSNT